MAVNYYTKEGLQKLKDELEQMKSVERPKISEQIAEARDKGDLSENAEYDAAKEAQGLLEMKISKFEELVSNARILDSSQMDVSKVMVLSNVKLRNSANGAVMQFLNGNPKPGQSSLFRASLAGFRWICCNQFL